MNTQIRRLGLALVVCFTILFAQLNYVQFFGAKRLVQRPDNTRELRRSFSRPRGRILSADGVVLARSVAERSAFKFRREYPEGDLFGPVTGYYSFDLGATGVERSYNEELAGDIPELRLQRLSDLFVDRENVGDLQVSLRADAQRAAKQALGDREGSVVALNPKTGELYALWSFPSYDPGPISTNDRRAREIKTFVDADPEKPLLARSYRELFFPGSTFKVVTGAVALDAGTATETTPSYPVLDGFDIDFTDRNLSNFGGSSCGGTLFEVLRVSCNSSFAQMGIDLTALRFVEGAQRFGFNAEPPIDLPGAATSRFPTEFPEDQGNGPLARAAIGQGDVSSTPLQMALVASAVANGGQIFVPHVLKQVTDEDGQRVKGFDTRLWKQAVTAPNAEVMRRAMLGVVADGSAQGLAIPGFEVGGKTGTAQLGTDPPRSHAWIIGFAGPPGDAQVAVAVIVEGQLGASEQTGGRVAAPIARSVMEAVLRGLEIPPTPGTGGG